MGNVVEKSIFPNGDFESHAADVCANFLLPHEGRLILRATDHDRVDLSRVADIVLVVMSNQDDVWLLTTL